jgi:L-histidine N-alpha-methyltransferase
LADNFAEDVRQGLSRPRKELPAKYLYDELGSALFEAITKLPEYGLTRADERLLHRCARQLGGGFHRIAELGSGSGRKARILLEAMGSANGLVYHPIDLSPAALDACQRTLRGVVDVRPLEAGFFAGLDAVAADRRSGEKLLVLFLGSTIGNFDSVSALDFLRQVRARLQDGDALLIGFDLVKPRAQLLAAYDDPTGVTAAFNVNLLGRINRELGGGFDLRNFAHEARYEEAHQRIEMHLRARCRQTVHIGALGLTVNFEESETIWTESSYKYRPEEIPAMAASSGFHCTHVWTDAEWPFCESLWTASLP